MAVANDVLEHLIRIRHVPTPLTNEDGEIVTAKIMADDLVLVWDGAPSLDQVAAVAQCVALLSDDRPQIGFSPSAN